MSVRRESVDLTSAEAEPWRLQARSFAAALFHKMGFLLPGLEAEFDKYDEGMPGPVFVQLMKENLKQVSCYKTATEIIWDKEELFDVLYRAVQKAKVLTLAVSPCPCPSR